MSAQLEPRAARRAVATCFLLNGVLFASWVSRIPAVRERLGLTPGTLGLALLCLGFGAIVVMPAAGWCIAHFGSRRVTQVCAIGYCLLLPLLAQAPTVAVFACALFGFGAVHGGFDVAMNAQAVAVEARYDRPIMASFHALWSFGGLLGAALGGVIAAAGVAPVAHFSMAALLGGLGCALALPWLIADDAAGPREEPPARGFALPPRPLVALGAIAFCVMMGEGAMADWSAIFLRDTAGAPEAVAAAGYAAFSIAMAAGRFTGDRLTARFGGVRMLRGGGALAVAGLLLALLFPQPATALLGFAAVGAGFATVVPVVFSAAGRVSEMDPGTALATTTTLGYTGFLIGPPFIGFMAELLGLRGALGLIVVTSLLLVVLSAQVGPPRRAVRRRESGSRAEPFAACSGENA